MNDVDELLTELDAEVAALAERLLEVALQARAAADARVGGPRWPELMAVDARCQRAVDELVSVGPTPATLGMSDLRSAVDGRWYGPPR